MNSLSTLYKNIFNHYFKSFPFIFPVLFCSGLLMVSILHAVTTDLSQHLLRVTPYTIGLVVGFLLISFFVHSIYIAIMHEKYHQSAFDYKAAIKLGVKRFVPVLGAWGILLTPAVLLLGLLYKMLVGANPALGIVFVILACVYFVYTVYFMFAPLLVISRNQSPWNAIKNSRQIVKGSWLKTALIMASIYVVIKLIGGLLNLTLPLYVSAIVQTAVWPLLISFIVVYGSHLENQQKLIN